MLPRWRPWLAWRVVQGLADYGPAPIANAQWEFNDTVLRGLEQPEPRSARVLEYVEHFLGDAMGQLYARRRYTAKVQARIGALVGNVLAEYAQTLAGVPWMSEVTRKRAIEKLGWLGARIGAPTRWHDYSELFIAPDDLLGNALRAASHLTESQVDKLVGNENGEEWQIPPHVVNAYYDIHRNEIVFPAAFLQPPYFDPDADDASNYGAIGAIVAHEISHGFDARGSRFDGRGRVRGWWLPGDAQAYAEIRARLVGQLADELGEGAELKADEAMSDLAGLAVAYRAWLRTTEGDVDEAAARRFFTSYAGIWRTVQRPEEARRRAATDPHPPPRTRCNLALTNFDPFHAAFGVKPSDGMWLRPGLRVRLW
jgi:putative endopeptidase